MPAYHRSMIGPKLALKSLTLPARAWYDHRMMIPADAMTALLDDAADSMLIRSLLIDIDSPDDELLDDLRECNDPIDDETLHNINALRETCRDLLNDPHNRELLTDTALALSLCPLHLHDYAICFDDAACDIEYADECAAIRTIHPSHDT
jgi:hypothetical protein